MSKRRHRQQHQVSWEYRVDIPEGYDRAERGWPLCPVRREGVGALCRLVYPHEGAHEWEVEVGA